MFILEKKLNNGTRIGYLDTPHGRANIPFFMPVGTVGSVKAMMPDEVSELGAEIILCNTYHLYLRPGEQNIKKLGGLHKFMNWDGPILTDSGGYQVFSLGKAKYNGQISGINNQLLDNCNLKLDNSNRRDGLVTICEDGVEFRSHLDGSSHFFTPEKVIDIQLDLGVDILMPLDVCPSGKATRAEVEEAVRLTIKWAVRSKKHFESRIMNYESCKRPLLHGIIQGGLDAELRKYCTEELTKLNFDGYSVGGLAVDFETRDMWKIVKLMGEILPENKQRYLMGVGTPDDIIKATQLGMDMFDCVLPTRLARHGSVYVRSNVILSHCESTDKVDRARREDPITQEISRFTRNDNYILVNLLKSEYRIDGGVIDEKCGCPACRGTFPKIPPELHAKGDKGGFSRAYISHLLRCNEILGIRLTTMHNLYVYLELMKRLRNEP